MRLYCSRANVSANKEFIRQINQVESTLAKVEDILTLVFEKVCYSGHENYMLPLLYDALALTQSVFECMNTEAARIGLIK